MKTNNWLLIAMMIGALAACGEDTDDKTTTDSGSSSGATDSGSSSGGTDGGGSSSGATDGGGSSGGPACLSGPATPTGGWGTGCTSKEDQTWFGTGDNVTTFPALIRKCTLGGCAGAGDDAKIQKCIGDCIVKGSKLSQGCSDCYGIWAGWCGFKKCIGACAVDDGTDKCDVCLACHCTPNRDACVAGDKK